MFEMVQHLRELLHDNINLLDYIKDLSEFHQLDKMVIMKLALIRSLSDDVLKKL